MRDAGSAPPRPPEETLPASRRAQWLPPVVIAVVVVLSLVQHPQPALAGKGLGVSVSLVVLVATTATLILRAETRITVSVLVALAAASAALAWLQPEGAGTVGLFVAVALAGIRLPEPQSILAATVALVLGTTAVIASAGHVYHSVGTIAGTVLGILAFYLVARFARSAADANTRTRRLLLELEATRHAEAEAAMLRERSRLARDMHDLLAHSLSGLMLQLEGARMLAAQSDPDGQLPPALDRAHHLARAGLDEARRAISALRDEQLPGPDRLSQLTADFEADSQIATFLALTGPVRELDSETSLTIYRVAQEALTNIRKHAKPDRVNVSLSYDPDATRLTVRDHASAAPAAEFPTRSDGGGYGLTGMRERAELLGGSLRAEQTADGFCVELCIPT